MRCVSFSTILCAALSGFCGACSGASTDVDTVGGTPGQGGSQGGSGSVGSDAPGSGGAGGANGVAGVGGSAGARGFADAAETGGGSNSGDAGADMGARADAARVDAADRDVAAGDGAGAVQPYKGVANSTCAELGMLRAAWYYDWKLSPEQPCTASEFVPMIWGHTGAEQSAAGIANEVKGIVGAGYRTVLGFNEPDNGSQSNLPVATAVALWPSFNDPAVRIGSPATQANSTGIAWFKDFMSQVNADTTGTLRVDFIAAHWYGWNAGSCEASASTLENYIKQIEAIPGNRPIWLTEWGCMNASNPDAATVQAFFKGALAMFAKHPRIERYAWYPWNTNNELFSNRNAMPPALSPLGTMFASAPLYK